MRQLGWLVIAIVAVGAMGFLGGWLFGTTQEGTASRRLVSEYVELAPVPSPVAGGPSPVCGVVASPVSDATQRAVIHAGGVVVEWRDDDAGVVASRVADEFATHVLVSRDASLDVAVVAQARRYRMRLDVADEELLRAFVRGYRLPAPGSECPLDERG